MKGMSNMKKRLIAVSNILFAIAAVLALAAGMNLTSMLDLSRDIISEAFPADYNVQIIGSNAVITDAEVFFNGSKAIVSSDSFNGTINKSDAIFTSTSADIISKNIVRSGMLFSLLAVLNIIAAAVPAFAAINLRTKASKLRRRRTARLECIANDQRSRNAVSAAA